MIFLSFTVAHKIFTNQNLQILNFLHPTNDVYINMQGFNEMRESFQLFNVSIHAQTTSRDNLTIKLISLVRDVA